MNNLREYFAELKESFRPHQRSFCYLNGQKVGYIVPIRDRWFLRPWSWVACASNGVVRGVCVTADEARALCIAGESRKIQSHIIIRNQRERNLLEGRMW